MNSPPRRCALLVVLLSLLVGCTVYQPNLAPSVSTDAPATYSFPVSSRVANVSWWEVFQDPTLSALISETLDRNYTIKQAFARIRQAEASTRGARAERFPELSAFGTAGNGWEEGGIRNRIREFGLNLAWEADVWGRLCAIEQSQDFERQATVYDWEAIRLLLSGQVANTYYRIIEQQEILALLDEQIKSSNQILALIELRKAQGAEAVSIVDVLQQREQVASLETETPFAQSDLRVLENRLAVLTGKPPSGSAAVPASKLPRLDIDRSAGVPSEVLMLRPDLRADASRLVSIDYRIGEAIADLYPRVSLLGSVSRRTTLDPTIWLADAVAGAVGPVMDSGRRKAEIDLRRALLEEQAAVFTGDFLVALEEVENALWREEYERSLIAALERQIDIGKNLLQETKIRYSQGLTDYLPVLDALQSLQEVERELITRKRELVTIRIALYLALGGPVLPSIS